MGLPKQLLVNAEGCLENVRCVSYRQLDSVKLIIGGRTDIRNYSDVLIGEFASLVSTALYQVSFDYSGRIGQTQSKFYFEVPPL